MSIALITVNAGIPDENDVVEVSALALPYLQRWLHENGYIHATEATTAQIRVMLTQQAAAPYVPNLGEVA